MWMQTRGLGELLVMRNSFCGSSSKVREASTPPPPGKAEQARGEEPRRPKSPAEPPGPLPSTWSQQPKNPSHQQIEEWYSTSASGESGEDAEPKEEAISIWSLPVEKLAQSQKKVAQLIKDKMNIQANKELIRCVSLSRIIFGEEHWKCAQAVASLAYGYLTLRDETSVPGMSGYSPRLGRLLGFVLVSIPTPAGLPCQAKKHAESAKTILLTWKGNIASDKEKKEILEALVMIYYTLGVAWLLQNHGQEAYVNLQKAERNMKELREFYQGSSCGFQVSENELAVALGRASLATQRLNLALTYFEKAIGNVIAAKGDRTSDLESLYEEIAQIEQLRKTHNQGIQYMQQAPHHLSVLGRSSSATYCKRKRHRCN